MARATRGGRGSVVTDDGPNKAGAVVREQSQPWEKSNLGDTLETSIVNKREQEDETPERPIFGAAVYKKLVHGSRDSRHERIAVLTHAVKLAPGSSRAALEMTHDGWFRRRSLVKFGLWVVSMSCDWEYEARAAIDSDSRVRCPRTTHKTNQRRKKKTTHLRTKQAANFWESPAATSPKNRDPEKRLWGKKYLLIGWARGKGKKKSSNFCFRLAAGRWRSPLSPPAHTPHPKASAAPRRALCAPRKYCKQKFSTLPSHRKGFIFLYYYVKSQNSKKLFVIVGQLSPAYSPFVNDFFLPLDDDDSFSPSQSPATFPLNKDPLILEHPPIALLLLRSPSKPLSPLKAFPPPSSQSGWRWFLFHHSIN